MFQANVYQLSLALFKVQNLALSKELVQILQKDLSGSPSSF